MRHRPCRFNFAVLITAMAVVAAPAHGGSVDPGEEPPGELRVLTFFDETTTSKCIGTPVTPLCAAETVMACFLRKRPELCATVRRPIPDWWPALPVSDQARLRSYQYKVIEVKTFTGVDIPDYRREPLKKSWRADDVRIVLRERSCGPSVPAPDHCMSWKSPPLTYISRRAGTQWRIIEVIVPRSN